MIKKKKVGKHFLHCCRHLNPGVLPWLYGCRECGVSSLFDYFFISFAHADVNLRDSFGKTPLHNAILGNQVKIVEMLLKSGADVKATDERGDTPLHTAVRVGNEDIVAVRITLAVTRQHFREAGY